MGTVFKIDPIRLGVGPEPGTVGIITEGEFIDLTHCLLNSWSISADPMGGAELEINLYLPRFTESIQIQEEEQDKSVMELIRLLEQKLNEREKPNGKK
jgi:hypothetical protein